VQLPPKKILIYTINFAPDLVGIGKYSGEMATWLAGRGHNVRVVTAPPYYPDWSVKKGYSASRWNRNTSNGIDVWRCPIWVPKRPGAVYRILHLASFALSSFPILLFSALWKPSCVWVVVPSLLSCPVALIVAWVSSAKSWLHIQDYEIDVAFELGILRGTWLRRIALWAELRLFRRFDMVSAISRRMLKATLKKGVDENRLYLFPNWVDLANFNCLIGDEVQPSDVSNPYRQNMGIPPETVVALYSGNMGIKQGLEILGDVAKLSFEHSQKESSSRKPKVNRAFVFCGNGPGLSGLKKMCEDLPNVYFLDLQPAECLPDLLAMADIHLLPQRADASDLVMPSKLTGMLASGRPVVVTTNSGTELSEVIEGTFNPISRSHSSAREAQHHFYTHQPCGLVVPPGDAKSMESAVRALGGDLKLRQRLGAAGSSYAKNFLDRDVVLEKFESRLLE
jgi:colanic acid biosynthesis glycosyl transferase WcaI